jgi:hypothetical protein
MENLTADSSSGVIVSVFGHAGLTPQAHLAFSTFKSRMGADFSLELDSLPWNECSVRAMENLTPCSVIFSVFGLTPQEYFALSWFRSGMGINFL